MVLVKVVPMAMVAVPFVGCATAACGTGAGAMAGSRASKLFELQNTLNPLSLICPATQTNEVVHLSAPYL